MRDQDRSISAIYPHTDWEIIEEAFDAANNFRGETIFALGNGYLGLRGTFEEGLTQPQDKPRIGLEGTYINGFYESEIIRYPEIAYAFPLKSQTMLNVTNGKVIRVSIEGEPVDLMRGTVREYRRVLSMQHGVLSRRMIWRSPQGREILLESRRLVSFSDKHLMAIEFQVMPLNFSGTITLTAELDGDVTNIPMGSDPRIGSGLQGQVLLTDDRSASEDGSAWLMQHTKHTEFKLACAMATTLQTEEPYRVTPETGQARAAVVYTVQAKELRNIRLSKYVAYSTSREPESDLLALVQRSVADARARGYPMLVVEQAQYMSYFWDRADVKIEGDPATQQGIRFNLFHLLQSVGKDGRTNIGAKGLTGEGYEGHYFWDTEMFVVPLFIYTDPTISRRLLEYRYHILPKARERARQMSHKRGALFPWRTINGEECSTYYPAGTAQYHINADIAFAIKQYMAATQDSDFLHRYGAEILFETARLWADAGGFVRRQGRKFNKFVINAVTGPDEYTAVVNNNCYTNLMAQENLWYAYAVAEELKTSAPEVYARITGAIGLEEHEIAYWKQAADAMFIPYAEDLGIYEQDDSFLDKLPWDFANTPPEEYPLLLHHHPLVIYRHQVAKQADLVLALFLLSHRFTLNERRLNYGFYKRFTTHDSSLSTCIFSVVASDIDYRDEAYKFFLNTARMDLDDYHRNTKDGIHAANMAGTWLSIVNGFGGMRVHDGMIHFRPYLPREWQRYSFNVTYQGRWLQVTVDSAGVTYTLREGAALSIKHNDEMLDIPAGGTVTASPRIAYTP